MLSNPLGALSVLNNKTVIAIIISFALFGTGCANNEPQIQKDNTSKVRNTVSETLLILVSVDRSETRIHGYLRCNYQTVGESETLSVTVKSKDSCPNQISYNFSTNDWIRKQ